MQPGLSSVKYDTWLKYERAVKTQQDSKNGGKLKIEGEHRSSIVACQRIIPKADDPSFTKLVKSVTPAVTNNVRIFDNFFKSFFKPSNKSISVLTVCKVVAHAHQLFLKGVYTQRIDIDNHKFLIKYDNLNQLHIVCLSVFEHIRKDLENVKRYFVVSEGAMLPLKIGPSKDIAREVQHLKGAHATGNYSGFQAVPLVDFVKIGKKGISCFVCPIEYDYDLFGWLEKNPPIAHKDNSIRITYCQELLRHLIELYKRNKRHGDIKPENIFVKKDQQGFQFLLGGFKAVKDFDETDPKEKYSVVPFTKYYTTEEEIYRLHEIGRNATKDRDEKFRNLSEKRDVFALGCVFFQILMGYPPFLQENNEFLKGKIYEKEIPLFGYPQPIIDLVKAMLRLKPEERPTIAGVAAALEVR